MSLRRYSPTQARLRARLRVRRFGLLHQAAGQPPTQNPVTAKQIYALAEQKIPWKVAQELADRQNKERARQVQMQSRLMLKSLIEDMSLNPEDSDTSFRTGSFRISDITNGNIFLQISEVHFQEICGYNSAIVRKIVFVKSGIREVFSIEALNEKPHRIWYLLQPADDSFLAECTGIFGKDAQVVVNICYGEVEPKDIPWNIERLRANYRGDLSAHTIEKCLEEMMRRGKAYYEMRSLGVDVDVYPEHQTITKFQDYITALT